MPKPSRFLPEDYDSGAPIAVIAGRYTYPTITVEAIRRAGVPVRLIALEGETSDELYESFSKENRARIKVGQIGKMLKALKKMNSRYVIMVGQVSPGRLFKNLVPDLKAVTLLASLKERNAESIFSAIGKEINKIGIDILDSRAFIDREVATEGVMTGGKLKADLEHINYGIRIAKETSRLDIGQGVVVRKGTVLAVEAYEGTDDMLLRANKYKTDKLIFVKTPKPNQNWCFDVPCFGLKTLQSMKESGIETAALEVDGVIILEKDQVIQRAKDWGIQLFGYSS